MGGSEFCTPDLGPLTATCTIRALPAHHRLVFDTEPVDGVVTGQLGELIGRGGVCVLSGAGLSTESGIPDYRGPSGALRARLPMTIAEFRGSPEARQRYWARAHIGWRRIAAARPNAGHRAVAALQNAGVLRGIITQNVDGLHQAAGARGVVELHGTLGRVVCLECGACSTRQALDRRLRVANPDMDWDENLASNPDGDVELADKQVARFRVVGCECCGADLLKPDVVFFGENVPRSRVQRCFELVDGSACLLVLGSSLSVMSGLRFVHRARQAQIPVAIVNRGETRGDPLADIKVDAALGDVLPTLAGAPQ
jgi:NAD-dependent SIR2 family protein deacetylase